MTEATTETVTLPRAEYLALVRRLEDVEDALAARDAEDDERIPHEVAKRLFGDENPVRVWRDYRGLSQRALAAKAGLTPSYLSAIESGRKPGSVAAYKALAAALDLAMDDLV